VATNQQTGDTRTTAKNKFGLQGQSPIDPSFGEVLPGGRDPSQKALIILASGGTEVRATHPGRVRSIQKEGTDFVVEISATQGLLDRATQRATPFTRYSNLGTLDIVPGERVLTGQQLGTVSFFRRGGQTSLSYQTFINGTGTKASEVTPASEKGREIVAQANPQGQPPDKATQLRTPPPEGEDALNREEPDTATIADLPTTGERVSNGDLANYIPQVRFAEQKNQVFNHDFMVFINGVDVTKYVVGSLSINLVNKDGFNEANFELNNTHDNFIVTNNNLGINDSLTPIFSAKKQILEYKNNEKRNPFVDIETMQIVRVTTGVADTNVLGRDQQAVGIEVRDQAEGSRQIAQRDTLKKPSGKLVDRRWHIGHQSTVFHKNDPIRIFRRNPLRETDEWMPAFTGYLNQISYNTNYVNGYSTVKLACYDIRGSLIQKMRVQLTAVTGLTNPRALFLSSEKSSKSLYTDLINPAILGHPLGAKRFEDVMEFLITGTAEQDPGLQDRFAPSEFVRGVGEFTVGDRIYYKPGKRQDGIDPDSLEHWHALCLFGMDGQTRIKGNESTTRAANFIGPPAPQDSLGTSKKVGGAPFNRRWLTEVEAKNIGASTTHDGEWAPHKQFLHFLLPAEGTGASNLLDFDAVNANSNQLDFRSRLDIMQDFCNRIDYQFWVTPIGDIVVEFPMYDFRPEDYGEFRTVFQVDKHLRSDNIQDEAGEMVTAIIAHGAITPLKGVGPSEQFQPKAVVVAPLMMMRYGVNEQELPLPFVGDPNSLARLAKLEFLKRLSESNKMDMDFDYRPFILPNRPIENVERKRMGLATAVRNSVEVFRSGYTTVTARYIRRQILNQDRKTVSYTFIFGGESAPITYREIFGEGAGQTGVVSADKPTKLRLKLFTLAGAPVEDSSSANLDGEEAIQTAENAARLAAVLRFAGNPPPTEQTSRFVALAQQLSGFNPFNRDAATGGFGLFALRLDVRGTANGGFGIGDTTDITAQLSAADDYYRGLISKHNGDLDIAISEFVLGDKKIKNTDILEEFKKGFLAVNKELGKDFEKVAQPLTDGFKKLFPGEKNPVDTQVATQSEASKEAEEEAAANPEESAKGSQATVGILVFDNRGDLETLQNKRNLTAVQSLTAATKALFGLDS